MSSLQMKRLIEKELMISSKELLLSNSTIPGRCSQIMFWLSQLNFEMFQVYVTGPMKVASFTFLNSDKF